MTVDETVPLPPNAQGVDDSFVLTPKNFADVYQQQKQAVLRKAAVAQSAHLQSEVADLQMLRPAP